MATHEPIRGTRGLADRLRSALPDVVEDVAAEEASIVRRRGADVVSYVVAIAIATATLADTWDEHSPVLRVIAILVGIATLVSLRWRRAHPAAVGIGIGIVGLVIITASGAGLVATFNAAIRAKGRDLAIIAALAVAWAAVNPLLYPPAGSYWFDSGASLLLAGVALGWGLFVRARRQLVRSLREQADRAGADARAAERRRIAREMHDVLAHRLSLLSVHAGALEFRPGAPPAEIAEAAGVIRENARAALTDLRSVIGVLREDGTETLTQPPQPTLDDLPTLIEESRTAGMRITARIDRTDVSLPDSTGRTAYRITQEGLTNARKHAPGTAVTLNLKADDRGLDIEIRSLPPVAVPATPVIPGAGTGLIGLSERVTLAGGELEHGVDPEGAFVLRAWLPR